MSKHPLSKLLTAAFAAPQRIRKPDPYRRQREKAWKLAEQFHIGFDKFKGGGMNVWPPADLSEDDPFAGDHFAHDWDEVWEMVKTYAAVACAKDEGVPVLIGAICPDSGTCHHGCSGGCSRMDSCAPLTVCTWLKQDWTPA